MTAIYHQLKSFRHALGLTQARMAGVMDVSLRQYRRYEAGEISIPSEKLVPLAVSHHLDLNWLFTGEGSMQRSPRPAPDETPDSGLDLLTALLEEYRRKLPDHRTPAAVRDIEGDYTPDEEEILQALLTLIHALYRP